MTLCYFNDGLYDISFFHMNRYDFWFYLFLTSLKFFFLRIRTEEECCDMKRREEKWKKTHKIRLALINGLQTYIQYEYMPSFISSVSQSMSYIERSESSLMTLTTEKNRFFPNKLITNIQTICFDSRRREEKTNQNTPSPYTFDLLFFVSASRSYHSPFSPKCEQFRIYLDFSMPNDEQKVTFFPLV